eukprot:1880373-Pleurochrysis_carterae.AAC.3
MPSSSPSTSSTPKEAAALLCHLAPKHWCCVTATEAETMRPANSRKLLRVPYVFSARSGMWHKGRAAIGTYLVDKFSTELGAFASAPHLRSQLVRELLNMNVVDEAVFAHAASQPSDRYIVT